MKLTLSVRSFQVPATPERSLAAELAFRANLAGDARYLTGEPHSADRPSD